MYRFYLSPGRCAGPELRLDGREAHHALHVLRVRRGDRVSVLDGAGREFFCEVTSGSRDALTLRVTEKKNHPAPPCSITLLQAIPKGKIIEDIIQKAVELGARRIVPLLTEHVVTRLDDRAAADKREKWQQVAIEAIKQCGAPWLPEIATPVSIEALLAHPSPKRASGVSAETRQTGAAAWDLSLVGSLQTERRHPRECIQEYQARHGHPPQSVGVWIGPEGDFTLAELRAIEAAGARPITLGSLTLRVETAAIYCLSILNYELSSGEQ